MMASRNPTHSSISPYLILAQFELLLHRRRLFGLISMAKLTPISEVGEFGLIDILTHDVKLYHAPLKGIGDDAAVFRSEQGKVSLLSTDLLLEGVHFDLVYTPLKHLGYKAVSVNVSDICAMNGKAKGITVGLGLSSKFTVEAAEEFYAGVRAACADYQIDILGGDTTSSRQGLVISITVWGEAAEEKVVYRSGAHVTDLICVSGDVGAAYLGLMLLEREKRVFAETPGIQPDFEGMDYLLERQLRPVARTSIIEHLDSLGLVPTSMIDISDGLASEVIHLCRNSGTGCRLYEEKLPIDPMTEKAAAQFKLVPAVCALNGGEDYELLFTIAQSDYEKLADDTQITIIGHMTDATEGFNLMTKSGNLVDVTAQGWAAF